ncbi:MAG: hypothetical protein ABI304_09385, partial [Rudaea sp.]
GHEVLEAKPFADRDHDIVDSAECVLATPQTRTEQAGSGTWATVRYAREQGQPVDLIITE